MLIAADTETLLIGPEDTNPRPVCITLYSGEGDAVGVSNGDAGFEDALCDVFGPGVTSIWANAKYDLICIGKHYPRARPLIYRALVEGRVIDIQIIERLGNLQDHGRLDGVAITNEDGEEELAQRFGYKVSELMDTHFGVDRTDAKEGGIRLAYAALDGVPFSEYDPDFQTYALQDAVDNWDIYRSQREKWGVLPTETLQVAADYALGNMTERGIALDPEAFYALRDRTLAEMDPYTYPLMLETGVMRAPLPQRPIKAQWKRAAALLGYAPDRDFALEAMAEDELDACAEQGMRLAEAKRESIDTKKLRARIEAACEREGIKVQRTETGLVATEAEFLMDLVDACPVIAEYARRQATAKILSTELPRMCIERDLDRPSPVIHPGFRILKKTGRTASAATDLFPSGNVQNVDPRARECYVARDGMLLVSIDFGAQDLVSLAQQCLRVLGFSILADNFNEGKCPHGYLGSVLASELSGEGRIDYETFMALKGGTDEQRAFFKHWRTFAKPTGLGFPGGLGPRTFVKYAKGTFGVITTEAEASHIRDVWMQAYPEMPEYFAYVNNVLARGENRFEYDSPMGMHRGRSSYCAAANGFGLQTPSAEATKIATWNLDRACFDAAAGNELLRGACWPLAQIHDEIIVEIPGDELTHERAHECARIMRDSMQIITPDVKVKAEPALMRRWNKFADPVYDEAGRLQVWEPQEK